MRQICANFFKAQFVQIPRKFWPAAKRTKLFAPANLRQTRHFARRTLPQILYFARTPQKHCFAKKLGKCRAKTQNFCRQKIKITFSKNLLA